jgi:UPF0176 protein
MALLHNRVSNKELKDRLMNESFKRTTISFYRYLSVENPQHFRDDLYKLFNAIQVFGRIYIAKEGINAQLSVPDHHLAEFKNILQNYKGLEDLRLNVETREKLLGIENKSA